MNMPEKSGPWKSEYRVFRKDVDNDVVFEVRSVHTLQGDIVAYYTQPAVAQGSTVGEIRKQLQDMLACLDKDVFKAAPYIELEDTTGVKY